MKNPKVGFQIYHTNSFPNIRRLPHFAVRAIDGQHSSFKISSNQNPNTTWSSFHTKNATKIPHHLFSSFHNKKQTTTIPASLKIIHPFLGPWYGNFHIYPIDHPMHTPFIQLSYTIHHSYTKMSIFSNGFPKHWTCALRVPPTSFPAHHTEIIRWPPTSKRHLCLRRLMENVIEIRIWWQDMTW